jgi:maleylpyruvate isomerase
VVIDGDSCKAVIDAVGERTRRIVESLTRLSEDELHQPSELAEWSRLTIVCHLRYGAQALARMTSSALQGRPVAYYPEGREVQRPRTLVPLGDESPLAVVESFALSSEELQQSWSAIVSGDWSMAVVEPPESPDLGPVPLGRLPLLRFTEVEVHGTDLRLTLDDWSPLFVTTVLPMRLEWLNTRRANH